MHRIVARKKTGSHLVEGLDATCVTFYPLLKTVKVYNRDPLVVDAQTCTEFEASLATSS